MNILDENIPKSQRLLLERQRIKVTQIGVSIGRKGLLDEQITPLLRSLHRPTFFTRDSDFYGRNHCHPRYCLVYLSVHKMEVAVFVRRLLRHPEFKTQASRMGTVIRVSVQAFLTGGAISPVSIALGGRESLQRDAVPSSQVKCD